MSNLCTSFHLPFFFYSDDSSSETTVLLRRPPESPRNLQASSSAEVSEWEAFNKEWHLLLCDSAKRFIFLMTFLSRRVTISHENGGLFVAIAWRAYSFCPWKNWEKVFFYDCTFLLERASGYVEYSPSPRRILIEKLPRFFAQNWFHICLHLVCRTFVERFQTPSHYMKRFLIVSLLLYSMLNVHLPLAFLLQ